MRSKNRSQWVNHWLLTLRHLIICPTSWLRRLVVQNAASLLVGLFIIFMTTSQSNRGPNQARPANWPQSPGLSWGDWENMTEWREYQRDSEYSRSGHLDPSWQNWVSEMEEHYKKVRCDVCRSPRRPGIGWHMLNTCLTRSLRNMPRVLLLHHSWHSPHCNF